MHKVYLFCFLGLLCACTIPEKKPVGYTQKEYYLTKGNDTSTVLIQLLNNGKYDFGKVNFGTVVKVAFRFKNISKSLLLINDATTSCGCTVTTIPPRPVFPDGIDSVIVSFDTGKGNRGFQNKVVTLRTNARNSPHLLTLYGLVE